MLYQYHDLQLTRTKLSKELTQQLFRTKTTTAQRRFSQPAALRLVPRHHDAASDSAVVHSVGYNNDIIVLLYSSSDIIKLNYSPFLTVTVLLQAYFIL